MSKLPSWHGDRVPSLLRSADDAAFRSGLCLAVAGLDSALPPPTVAALDEALTRLYTTAPDGGTHGAAECAQRRRGLPLPVIAPTPGPAGGRGWFINRQGMAFLAVPPG